MFVAETKDCRIEFDGQTVTVFDGWKKLTRHDFSASSVKDVKFNRPGTPLPISPGSLRFKAYSDALNRSFSYSVSFGPGEAADFGQMYEALSARIAAIPTIRDGFERLIAPGFRVPPTTPATLGVVTRTNLRIGEVSRHFDSRTAGEIGGSIAHEFGFRGGALAMLGGMLGVNDVRLSGQSEVDLRTQSNTRTDLLNDGFVAVFDEPSPLGVPDTLRVVVPSDAACHQMLGEFMTSAGAAAGLTPSQLDQMRALAAAVSTETGYVADRLSAVLRASPTPAPVFSVVGIEAGSHSLLGGAIQMPGDERWIQLFPVGLLREFARPDDQPQLQAAH